MTLPVIDAHHHLWDPRVADYPWMTGPLEPLRRPYGPGDLEPLISTAGVTGTIAVQARQSLDETRSLLATAAATPWLVGVVGWVDLCAPDVADTLAEIQESDHGGRLVGVRHLVHDEPDPEWLLRDDVLRGLAAVARAGLTYDLLVRTRELAAATRVARRIPELRFVVDHLAKPPIATGQTEPWASAVAAIARLPNVTCKVSGMVTEADWTAWEPADLAPYVATVVDLFGPDRLMWGSDWPVCTVAASYTEVLESAVEALSDLLDGELAGVLGGCASATYRLDPAVGPG